MRINRNLKAILLSSYGLLALNGPSLAVTETTTIKTTTVTKDGSNTTVEDKTTTTEKLKANVEKTIVLPPTGTYILVDPISGRLQGTFTPGQLSTATVTPGWIVVDQSSGRLVASISTTGNTVDIISAPAMVTLLNAIESRRAELEQLLNYGLNKGSIDPNQAAALRSELDKIMLPEVVAQQNGKVLTYTEALSLSLALNNFADRLTMLTNAPVIAPLIGTRIISTNGQIVMVDEVTSRRIHLSQRIDDEYAAGRLSNQQVARLRSQLDSVATLDSKYRRNGELSESNTLKVANKLDKVDAEMNRDIAIINEKRSKIGIRVQ